MGIYFFGGLDEYGFTTNDLYVLRVGTPMLYWSKPETKGVGPCPRFGHSMHYVEFMNCILIFGGRNNSDVLDKTSEKIFLNDMWLLKMDNLEWVKVTFKGQVPK